MYNKDTLSSEVVYRAGNVYIAPVCTPHICDVMMIIDGSSAEIEHGDIILHVICMMMCNVKLVKFLKTHHRKSFYQG